MLFFLVFIIGCSSMGSYGYLNLVPTRRDWSVALRELPTENREILQRRVPIYIDLVDSLDEKIYIIGDFHQDGENVGNLHAINNWKVDLPRWVSSFNDLYGDKGGVHYRLIDAKTFGTESQPNARDTYRFVLVWRLQEGDGRVITVMGGSQGDGLSLLYSSAEDRQADANKAFAGGVFGVIANIRKCAGPN